MHTSSFYLKLLSVLLQSTAGPTPPPPAIGDIRLVQQKQNDDFYEVQIYYTDGLTEADFGGVCADKSYMEESIVICHQMGYKFKDFQYR